MSIAPTREAILEAVRAFQAAKVQREFVPGETYLPPSGKVMDADDAASLVDASLDMWLTAGRFHRKFQKELAEFCGLRKALPTVSGSAANLLAFTALTSPKLERPIAPGSEVITVAAGFPTTVNPIVQNGCVPVFVDVDLATHNIDVSKLEQALSETTRAVMVAHTLGNPFDLATVSAFCEEHELLLIEDCCDALGAKYEGRPVGTFGTCATLSFYPAHHITMGEGGAVLTDSPKLHKILESFRDWGRDCWCEPGKDNTCGIRFGQQLGDLPLGYDHKYIYSHLGYNLKITDMQAAVGSSQLAKARGFIEARVRNHDYLLAGFKRAGLDEFFSLSEATPKSEPSWFGFALSLREESGMTRPEVVQYLEQHKVGTRLMFSGNLVKQPAYAGVNYRVAGGLEVTDQVMNQSFWVGCWPGLTEPMLDYMLATFEQMIQELKR